MIADALNTVDVGGTLARDVWERLYSVTAFYVGIADDLTPFEYSGAVNKVYGSAFEVTDLADSDKFHELKVELALMRSPEIFGGTGNAMVTPPLTPETLQEVLDKTKGLRFMGQRYIPDSYMFQQLVFPAIADYTGTGEPFTLGNTGVRLSRCYPRGLDVMAVMGSDLAEAILVEEGDTEYIKYAEQFAELQDKFAAFSTADWNRNLYWGWLYSLQALLIEFGTGYPAFMQTEAWHKKELNAALASWAELRHDTILYAKQSYTPRETGMPEIPPGYVEPVPEFYARLLSLTRMTRTGLTDLDAISTEAVDRLVALETILERLYDIAAKELRGEALTEDDHMYIKNFGETLERVVLGVDDVGVKTSLIADVHTHTAEGLVLEEGVGYVDLLVAACPRPDGDTFLAVGPVLSYYEFKHPMGDRLTDEAWRDMLASGDIPARPPWYSTVVVAR